MGRRRDLLSILDAAYALERTEDEWLQGLASAVRANVRFRTIGVVVNGYDISNAKRDERVHAALHAASAKSGSRHWASPLSRSCALPTALAARSKREEPAILCGTAGSYGER